MSLTWSALLVAWPYSSLISYLVHLRPFHIIYCPSSLLAHRIAIGIQMVFWSAKMTSLPPGIDLSTISLVPPPSGMSSNFVDPESLANIMMPVEISMLVSTVLVVIVRLLSNHHATRGLGWDDCIIPWQWWWRDWTLTCFRLLCDCHRFISDLCRHKSWPWVKIIHYLLMSQTSYISNSSPLRTSWIWCTHYMDYAILF